MLILPLQTMLFVSIEYSTATKAARAQRSALDFPESYVNTVKLHYCRIMDTIQVSDYVTFSETLRYGATAGGKSAFV